VLTNVAIVAGCPGVARSALGSLVSLVTLVTVCCQNALLSCGSLGSLEPLWTCDFARNKKLQLCQSCKCVWGLHDGVVGGWVGGWVVVGGGGGGGRKMKACGRHTSRANISVTSWSARRTRNSTSSTSPSLTVRTCDAWAMRVRAGADWCERGCAAHRSAGVCFDAAELIGRYTRQSGVGCPLLLACTYSSVRTMVLYE
jgi:hypothetical protein